MGIESSRVSASSRTKGSEVMGCEVREDWREKVKVALVFRLLMMLLL